MKEESILECRRRALLLARDRLSRILDSEGIDYVIFTGVLDYRYRDQFVTGDLPENKFLIWLTVDYLVNDIASLSDQKRQEFLLMEQVARQRPQQIFIIGSVLTNLDQAFDSAPSNLKTLWMGHDLFYLEDYDRLQSSSLLKRRDTSTHWISLSSNCMHWRLHRPLAGLCLLGHDLESTGILRFSAEIFKDDSDWDNYCCFHRFNGRHEIDLLEPWTEIFRRGFMKSREWSNQNHVRQPYLELKLNDFGGNFSKNLKPLYALSAVEIINETIFFQASGLVTEKYLNSIYGDVFPIMLGTAGTVADLRNLGFDMFDDVIDHSYDSIKEPLIRLARAIELNAGILRDRDQAWRQWDLCEYRFLANRQVFSQVIRDFLPALEQRFRQLLRSI